MSGVRDSDFHDEWLNPDLEYKNEEVRMLNEGRFF